MYICPVIKTKAIMKNSKGYNRARRLAVDSVRGATPWSDLFDAGYDFATSQPKHILDSDYPIQVGDIRRYKGGLYRAEGFVIDESGELNDCQGCAFYGTPCGIVPCDNSLKFTKIS